MPAFLYSLSIEDGRGSILVDWGNSPDWKTLLAAEIEAAGRISLIPKEKGSPLPIVTVAIKPGHKPVILSRVFGRVSSGGMEARIRTYCIGQVDAMGREEVVWVYPNGTVESAMEPGLANLFFNQTPVK